MISKNNILNTIILKSPLESKPLQICLLLFSYISDLALNTLFSFIYLIKYIHKLFLIKLYLNLSHYIIN